jgi:TolA-binding protein
MLLIQILIILFTIIIFYEIFNDAFSISKKFVMYENFATSANNTLPDQNNKDVGELQKVSTNQDMSINDINSKLSKLNDNINILNQKIKAKSDVGLQKYNEITEGADVDINNTENL